MQEDFNKLPVRYVMRILSKVPIILGVTGWMIANAWAGESPPSGATAAVQAIQQASDPSAVVAAYANGVATDRHDPKLDEAYVSRMVDLGLPELAFHQAQTLTTLQSNNGLAWGVLAYVDARRGDMPEAVSAINLAGQSAPNNPFVQRTAGEIVAWYDIKAEKPKLPDNAKDGLTKIRTLLQKEPAFTAAYDTAKNAYAAQASAVQAPTQGTPSPYGNQGGKQSVQPPAVGYAGAVPPPPVYSPDYYYDWGPGWVEPAPWWWWQPVGFFAGFDFFPFSTVIVFDHHHFFHHHHFFAHDRSFHDHGFAHDRFFHRDGLNVAFRDSSHAFFARDSRSAFFGAAARPNSSLASSARASFASGRTFATSFARHAMPARQGVLGTSHPSSAFAPFAMRPGVPIHGQTMMPAFSGNMFAHGFRVPAFAAPRMGPHAMATSRSFASRGMGFGGGSHGGGGFHGGGGHR